MPRLMQALAAGLACLVATGLACGDSTAPPNPSWDGGWSVTTSTLDAGGVLEGMLEPTPFLLTIVVNGNALSDTFPTLTWSEPSGAWTFPWGQPNDAIVGHADTLLWRVYSEADTLGKTCTLVYRGVLVGTDSVRGSVLVSGTNAQCAAANGGSWAGKRQ